MSSIRVGVRCRPLFANERAATGLDLQGRRILLDSKTYDPDFTFPPSASQDDVFAACVPILECVKDGLNGTIMVYGQTGTGKTYTMLGNDGEGNGVAHKVIAHMLEHVQAKTVEGLHCALTLSIVEIYNERLTDMLSPNGAEEVTLIGGFPRLTNKVTLGCMQDASQALRQGLAWRHTAKTLMNERSSRSHVVFILDLEEFNAYTEETDVAHLFLVDLAGSESVKKSQASGSVAGEAGRINKSLLALKGVFLALSNTNEATRPTHVPYRDSKLTELLQDSIGGTARTLMIACISSVGRDIEETKSTLSYAVKARSIRNAANTEREKLLTRLRTIEAENQRLRNRLQERVNEKGGYYVTKEEHEQGQRLEEEMKQLRGSVDQLVKESQASDIRKHISDSQAKVLQGMLHDKEQQLQHFKEVYHDALSRFESHAVALQRVVRGAVAEAQRVVQRRAAADHRRLVGWRDGALRALGDGPPHDALERASEKGGCDAAEEGPALPSGGDRDGDGATGPLDACEASCRHLAARASQAFRDLLRDLTEAHERTRRLVQAAEERRCRQTDKVCRRLRESLEQGLERLGRAQRQAADDIEAAQQDAQDCLSARGRFPDTVDPLPLQHAMRDACRATVRQAERAFPSAEAPPDVTQSLESIARAYEGRLTAMRVAALLPLSSAAVGPAPPLTHTNAANSVSADEPQQRGRPSVRRPSRLSVNAPSQFPSNGSIGGNAKAPTGTTVGKRTRSSNSSQSIGKEERGAPAARADTKG